MRGDEGKSIVRRTVEVISSQNLKRGQRIGFLVPAFLLVGTGDNVKFIGIVDPFYEEEEVKRGRSFNMWLFDKKFKMPQLIEEESDITDGPSESEFEEQLAISKVVESKQEPIVVSTAPKPVEPKPVEPKPVEPKPVEPKPRDIIEAFAAEHKVSSTQMMMILSRGAKCRDILLTGPISDVIWDACDLVTGQKVQRVPEFIDGFEMDIAR